MDAKTRTDLVLMRAQRNRLVKEARQIDLEIGRLADRAITDEKYTTTKSSIGRLLGMSHTHVGNLIDAARSTPEPETGDRIPVMENVLAADYVDSVGARVIRCVSGFHEGDVLVASGLDPRLFAGEDDRVMVPQMLWKLDTGEWVGLSQVGVGYGGTGGHYARQALVRAGVDEQAADEIVRWRFCDTGEDIDGPVESWKREVRWPVHARSVPCVVDDRIVVLFGEKLRSLDPSFSQRHRLAMHQPAVDESGFLPSETEQTPLEAWLSFLDQNQDQLPEWAQGSRLARVYRHDEAAAADGFTAVPFGTQWASQRAHPCVVIEQGMVQLWGFFFRPRDTTQHLPEEAYEVLRVANVYPHYLVEHDDKARRPWARFMRTFVPHLNDLPDSIDISRSGSEALAYLPSRPVAHLG